MFLNTLQFDVIYLHVFFKIKLISFTSNTLITCEGYEIRFKEALKYLMNVKHLMLFPIDLLRKKMHFSFIFQSLAYESSRDSLLTPERPSALTC